MHTKFLSEKLKETKRLEHEAYAYSSHSLWVTGCLAKLCYVACRDILDEEMFFLTLPLAKPR